MQQEKESEIELVQKNRNLVQKDGNLIQKDGNRNGDRWNKKKKRGPNRQTVTLGGLKKETQTKITAKAEVKETALDEARNVPEGKKGRGR
jgi:hypothetical protein